MKKPAAIPSHVYVLAATRGPVKIGASVSPERRAKEERHMVSGRLLVRAVYARPDDARAVERLAHWLMREKRTRGEWYAAPVADAIAAIEEAIRRMDAKDFDGIPRAALPKVVRPRRFADPLPQRDWATLFAEMNAWAEANPEEMEKLMRKPGP